MKASYEVYAKLRDERGYSDYRVARETRIGAATLSDWKNNISTPKADKIFLIAKLFEIPAESLYKEE